MHLRYHARHGPGPTVPIDFRRGARRPAFSIDPETTKAAATTLARGSGAVHERLGLKASIETEATLMFVDEHALLKHATTASGRDMATFTSGPIRPRSARLARFSANIEHPPNLRTFHTAASPIE